MKAVEGGSGTPPYPSWVAARSAQDYTRANSLLQTGWEGFQIRIYGINHFFLPSP